MKKDFSKKIGAEQFSKMVGDCISEIEFGKIRTMMHSVDWTYLSLDDTPDVHYLVELATHLCWSAFWNYKESDSDDPDDLFFVGSGGFEAAFHPEMETLRIKFVASEAWSGEDIFM